MNLHPLQWSPNHWATREVLWSFLSPVFRPQLLWIVMVFQICLLFVFNDRSGFEKYWSINQVFCRMCLSLDLSAVFSGFSAVVPGLQGILSPVCEGPSFVWPVQGQSTSPLPPPPQPVLPGCCPSAAVVSRSPRPSHSHRDLLKSSRLCQDHSQVWICWLQA